MTNFKEGQEIQRIYFWDGSTLESGKDGCGKFTVTMEPGPTGPMPWFEIWVDGKVVAKYNAALTEGVELKPEEPKEGLGEAW